MKSGRIIALVLICAAVATLTTVLYTNRENTAEPASGEIIASKEISVFDAQNGIYDVTLNVRGKSVRRCEDVVILLHLSAEADEDRIKAAAKRLIERVLEDGENRVALARHSDNGFIISSFSHDRELLYEETEKVAFSKCGDLSSGIVTAASLFAADGRRDDRENGVFVSNALFILNGSSIDATEEAISAAQHAKDAGITIYALDMLSGEGTEEYGVLKWIQNGGYAEISRETDLNIPIDTLCAKLNYAGLGAMVEDHIGENFLLYPNSVIGNADTAIHITENDIRWEIGTVTDGVDFTLTYRIKKKTEVTDGIYYTGDNATLSYTDIENNKVKTDFPNPLIKIGAPHIQEYRILHLDADSGAKIADDETVKLNIGTEYDSMFFLQDIAGYRYKEASPPMFTAGSYPEETVVLYYQRRETDIIICHYYEGKEDLNFTEILPDIEVGSTLIAYNYRKETENYICTNERDQITVVPYSDAENTNTLKIYYAPQKDLTPTLKIDHVAYFYDNAGTLLPELGEELLLSEEITDIAVGDMIKSIDLKRDFEGYTDLSRVEEKEIKPGKNEITVYYQKIIDVKTPVSE